MTAICILLQWFGFMAASNGFLELSVVQMAMHLLRINPMPVPCLVAVFNSMGRFHQGHTVVLRPKAFLDFVCHRVV